MTEGIKTDMSIEQLNEFYNFVLMKLLFRFSSFFFRISNTNVWIFACLVGIDSKKTNKYIYTRNEHGGQKSFDFVLIAAKKTI